MATSTKKHTDVSAVHKPQPTNHKPQPANGKKAMDLSFIQKPHQWDPRRLYSQTACDWQYRVDFERLRKDRLQRLREEMTAKDLGALVLFAGANIRYATGSYQGNWKYNINIRYAVVPNGGEPVLFETAGSRPALRRNRSALDGKDSIRPAITWQWAEGAVPHMAGRMVDSVVDVLKEHGLKKERIGIDNLDMAALRGLPGGRHQHRGRLAGGLRGARGQDSATRSNC